MGKGKCTVGIKCKLSLNYNGYVIYEFNDKLLHIVTKKNNKIIPQTMDLNY